MNDKKKEIDELIEKLDRMIQQEESKEEIQVVLDELNKLLEEYLEE